MKLSVCIIFLSIMVGIVGLQSAQSETTIVNGAAVDDFGLPLDINSVAEPLGFPNYLDFSAPCFFANTVPVVKNSFKHLGFTLKGNGAVLNECGNFEITGYSPPDFLAFNCNAVGSLLNGATPSLPQRITFKPPVSSVSFRIGSGNFPGSAGQVVHATINKKVYTFVITLANTMPQYTYNATGPTIKTLDFTVPEGSNACVLVIDDIQTTP